MLKITSISAHLEKELLALQFGSKHFVTFCQVYDTRHSSRRRFYEKLVFNFQKRLVGELQVDLDLKTTGDVSDTSQLQ